MNISFNLELSSKASSNGDHTILIRCSQLRQHRRISTGIQIQSNQWDPAAKKVKRHPFSKEYNQLLDEKMKKVVMVYQSLLSTQDRVTLEEVFKMINQSRTNSNFFDFAYQTKMADIRNSNKLGTYRRYETVLQKLKEYTGPKLSIIQVNYSFLKEYARHLTEVRKNGPDTVSANLSVIRTIINEAERHGLLKDRNPFNQLSLRYTDNTKQKLSAEELRRLFTYPLPAIPSIQLARDFFLACFLAEGCRAGDMILMKKEHIQQVHLIYVQAKTGKRMACPIVPELADIFRRNTSNGEYLFPFLEQEPVINELVINSKITYINKYLKEVAKYCGIFKKLTTHVARHTYTDLALQATGGNIYQVQQSLGHSSVKTTELYTRQSVNFQRTSVVQNLINNIFPNGT